MRWLLLFLCMTCSIQARPARDLPVLCYHQVANGRMGDDMTIAPGTFESHLRYLKSHGYHTVTLEQARRFLWGDLQLPDKPILLTFDDGYEGVYSQALPLLQKYNYRAVVFLVVAHIGDARAATRHLTLAELKKLKASGLFEFGSHTYNLHVLIPERRSAGRVFPAQILADLRKSRSELKRLLGVDVQALAWPYGHYDKTCVQLAARAGFRLQFTTDYGYNQPHESVSHIRRLRVSANSNDVFTLDWKLAHQDSSSLPH